MLFLFLSSKHLSLVTDGDMRKTFDITLYDHSGGVRSFYKINYLNQRNKNIIK